MDLAGVLALVALCLATAGVLVAALARRETARRHERLDAELLRARAEVAALQAELARLADRPATPPAPLVITSWDGDGPVTGPPAAPVPRVAAPAAALETRLVAVLAQERDRSPVHARAVTAAVRALALGHGVRRALAPEVRDRAAAASHVARRRSRRTRRQQEREVRRLVRAAREAA